MEVFGPVPSRRLGRSLGVNNIPPKTCSYSCVYCQLGRTFKMQVARSIFYEPEYLFDQVKRKVDEIYSKNEKLDFVTFVADGEPILDMNLGRHIEMIKCLGVKVAIITNGSLLWMDEVKNDLNNADWVSVKVDAYSEKVYKRIDRPHGKLDFDMVKKGILDFSKLYKGYLATETMLVEGYNDSSDELSGIAGLIQEIDPRKAYILVPLRPPAESDIKRPDDKRIMEAYAAFSSVCDTECIIGDEGDEFFVSDDIVGDLISILAVHPVRSDIILKMLEERGFCRNDINDFIYEFEFEGRKFFRKRLVK